MWSRRRLTGGQRIDALIQHFDLVPLLFETAGVALGDRGAARSAGGLLDGSSAGRDHVFAEHGRCNMLPDIESMVMARSREWKLVHYPGQEYGELYDLRSDPLEMDNRWSEPGVQAIKSGLIDAIQRHGISRQVTNQG